MIQGAFQHFGFLKKSFKAKLYLIFNNLQMSLKQMKQNKDISIAC